MLKTINKLIERNTKLEETMFEIFMNEASLRESVWNLIADFDEDQLNPEEGHIGDLTYNYQMNEIFKENFIEIMELLEDREIEELNATWMVWKTFKIMSTNWIYLIESYYENGCYDGWEFVVEE